MQYLFNLKKVHYTLSGTGPCVVLLHGFTEDAGIWTAYAEVLSKQFTVLTPDLPGHGQSEAWDTAHTMEAQADMLRDLLALHNIKEVVLIGHSMGGYVAMAFAEAWPEYLWGLGLFHSSATSDSPEAKANRDKVIELVKKNKFGFLAQFIPDLFAPENRHVFEKEIQSLIDKASAMKPEGIINAIEGMKQRPDRLKVLENIKVPVLFVAGKKDSRVPVEKVLTQLALPRRAEALILEQVGHMGYIEAKEEVLRTFNNFINKIYSK